MNSYNVINYIDLCSNAFLSLLNNDEANIEYDDNTRLILTPHVKQLIQFYIKSHLNDSFNWGKFNIVVNTCKPMNNWRKEERGKAIRETKYVLVDETLFDVDMVKLERLFDKTWNDLKKEKKFIFLSIENIDTFDLVHILCKKINHKIKTQPYHHFVIKDVNNEYLHHDTIPDDILLKVEIQLRKCGLI